MVSFENEEKKSNFPLERLNMPLFLSSLRDFATEGVDLSVEGVSRAFVNQHSQGKKAKIAITFRILSAMSRCRLFVINEDENKYEMMTDPRTGDLVRKVTIEAAECERVVYYPSFRKKDSDEDLSDETELKVHKMSSAYPLVRAGFVANGDLAESQFPVWITFTQQELKSVLQDLEFRGKYRHVSGRYEYDVLDVEL